MKYVYSAVFTQVDDGYSVELPDLPGCITGADTMADALAMIEDAGAMWLWDAENHSEEIPAPTPLEDVETGKGQVKSFVLLDTDEYRRANENRAVKKNAHHPKLAQYRSRACGR